MTTQNKQAKIMYSTVNDDKIHLKTIGKHRSQFDDIKLLLNNGFFESMTLYKNGKSTNYHLIFDEDGIQKRLDDNTTMSKMGIKLKGNVVIVKANDNGDNVDIDIDLKQLRQMIKHTVELRRPNEWHVVRAKSVEDFLKILMFNK
jgi:hypothetical protein